MAPQKLKVRVLIGEVFPLDFKLGASAIQVEGVSVVAAAGVEMRASEVATNVTQQQIERLPTPSRNFLDLAALAPGVTVLEDRINSIGSRPIQAGGQSPNAVNVFVDGTSLKNDLTGGGVPGQDASRGNPFPRNAIQEYRVISQNFKAEYQKAGSAIITATTKSGGNVWSGNVLFGYQNKDLMPLDTFQTRDKHVADSIARTTGQPSTFSKPDYSRSLLALSAGGPLVRNRLFFFASYEGNYPHRANRVNFTPPTGFPALDTVNLAQYNGNFTSPFRETLLFGKLTYTLNPQSSAEVSVSNRHETDIRDFGPKSCCPLGVNAFQEAVNFRQNVTVAQLKYNRYSGAWLNEAKVDYSRFRRNPSPNEPGVAARVYSYSITDTAIGSHLSSQDFLQKRLALRDDLTYQAGSKHVFKMGASFDFVKYDVLKGNDETPRFAYRDTVSGVAYDFRNPYELKYGTGNALLNKSNNEIGAYLQDDWSPTPRLTINLGIRWDFESHMYNYDYVTPTDVRDTIRRYDTSPVTPAESLVAKLDTTNYFTNGTQRKKFYGAFQPRIGFSYALDREGKTTVFGGWGLYYDRTYFDISVDETLKLVRPEYTVHFADPDSTPTANQVAWQNSYMTADTTVLKSLITANKASGREVWLIANDVKVPKSSQFNLGIRHLFGDVAVSATYVGVRSWDGLGVNWANRAPNRDGSCCVRYDY